MATQWSRNLHLHLSSGLLHVLSSELENLHKQNAWHHFITPARWRMWTLSTCCEPWASISKTIIASSEKNSTVVAPKCYCYVWATEETFSIFEEIPPKFSALFQSEADSMCRELFQVLRITAIKPLVISDTVVNAQLKTKPCLKKIAQSDASLLYEIELLLTSGPLLILPCFIMAR